MYTLLITQPILRVRTRGINECKRFSLPSQSLGSEPEESMSVNVSHYPTNPEGQEPEESMSVNVSHYPANP